MLVPLCSILNVVSGSNSQTDFSIGIQVWAKAGAASIGRFNSHCGRVGWIVWYRVLRSAVLIKSMVVGIPPEGTLIENCHHMISGRVYSLVPRPGIYLVESEFIWGAWRPEDECLDLTYVAFVVANGESCIKVKHWVVGA